VTAGTAPPSVQPASSPQSLPSVPSWPLWLARELVGLFGSMRLTVVLLGCLFVLTFIGTVGQVQRGIYEVQKEIFEGWWFWWGWLPVPGAFPVMALLFVNLVVGGLLRMRWQLRNSGILIVHLGISLLLLAGFVKLHFSVSGNLALFEGRANSLFVSFHEWELVLLQQDGDTVRERTLPAESFAAAASDGPVHIDTGSLPFQLVVQGWLENCRPLPKGPLVQAQTPVIDGVYVEVEPLRREREQNVAGCYIDVVDQTTGQLRSAILWGAERRPFDDRRFPFTFTAGGQRYGLDLRRVVWDLPFNVRLDKFQKQDHPGTTNPRDYSSWVTVREPTGDRQVHIFMNAPLRKDGYVIYQANWGPQDGSGPPMYSVFEVARNPSDVWPKFACYVIAFGLIVHFGRKLYRYIHGEQERRARTEAIA